MGEKEVVAERRRRARKEIEREREKSCLCFVVAKILFLQGEDRFVVLLLQREDLFFCERVI